MINQMNIKELNDYAEALITERESISSKCNLEYSERRQWIAIELQCVYFQLEKKENPIDLEEAVLLSVLID